jgi:Flp pilus assembly protein TadG
MMTQQILDVSGGGSTRKIRGYLHRFAADESGVMAIFGVYIFIMMLMIVGIGVDLMRYERDRANLQYTLDRAVLAAADLDQPLEPNAVVNDYFAKAGLSDFLSSVNVTSGLGYRVVQADATKSLKTHFMHMTGVDTLSAPASAQAEERIDNVEISLVLDVSGSMGSNNRLPNLKTAAHEFIDSMFDNSEDGKVSISIIPYATQVSLPQEMVDHLDLTDEHNYSRCVNFESSDFSTTTFDSSIEHERTMHFDPWDDFDGRDNDPVDMVRYPVCWGNSGREIMVMENNRTRLKNFVSGFFAEGNTSIDVGMKWGTALLDPTFQPVIQAMADDNDVPGIFSVRPDSHTSSRTIKVVVLMTDGQNTDQYYLNEGFREGQSNIWWNEQEEIYSVYVGLDEWDADSDGITNEPLFFWPMDYTWRDHAYGEGTFEEEREEWECTSYRRNGSCRRYRTVVTTVTVDEPGEAVELSYADLWAYTSMERIVELLYEPFMDDWQAWNDWYYAARNYVDWQTKDDRTRAICDAAKANNTIVFTIGFEAPSRGQQVLADCASTLNHYFDVDGLEISDAFASIAASIRQLRLTQ